MRKKGQKRTTGVCPGATRLAAFAAALAVTAAVLGQAVLRAGPAGASENGAGAKIGPLLRHAAAAGGAIGLQLGVPPRAPLFIKHSTSRDLYRRSLPCYVRFDSDNWEMSIPGVSPVAVAGDVALVTLNPGAVEALAASREVRAIELAVPLSFKNDVATFETGAVSAKETYAVSGSGVILGFIGSGVDVTHPDLRNEDGSTRVLYLLDLSHPGDTDGDGLLDGDGYFGGTLYNKAGIDSALAGLLTISGSDNRGHETHVMGIAAGNGLGTGNGFPAGTYAGVAPDAGLIVVKSSLADIGFVGPGEASAGLAFVDSIAGLLGMPYVVNMSFGTHLSAHDGTSPEERFIDNTIGGGIGGKAVIVAAGNEGSNDDTGPFLHCSTALREGVVTDCELTIPAYSPQPGELNDGMILDLWYEGGDDMTVSVTSPGGSVVTAATGESRTRDVSDGSITIDNALFANPINSDNECLIQIDDGGGVPPSPGEWLIEIEGTHVPEGGRFDLWIAHTAGLGGELGFSPTSPVSNERLVASPGNAAEAITVGSYTNKESWRDIDNNIVFFETLGVPAVGEIAPGSGPGPTRDGRLKPELTAPGRALVSTLSKDALPGSNPGSIFSGCSPNAPGCLIVGDGVHAVARGTSFSAAHVAGAAALLFEIKPDLDASELKNALAYSARPHAQTGGPWGYGRLDVLAAAEAVSASAMVELFSGTQTLEGVLIDWKISGESPVEELVLYRSGSLQGPYEIIHSTSILEGSFLDIEILAAPLPFYRLGLVVTGGSELPVAPISPAPLAQKALSMMPPFPNPSQATTTIRFTSQASGTATVSAFDAAGRLVRESRVAVQAPGSTVDVLWPWLGADDRPLASGIYYLVVEIKGERVAAKSIVLR